MSLHHRRLDRLRIVLMAAACVLVASLAHAHDFWLVPDAFAIAPNGRLRVRGQTSSDFPMSLSAVTPDRIADARLLGAQEDVALSSFRTSGKSLVLEHRPAAAGQHVVVMALKPRLVRDAAAAFRRYMELEGAPELAARYAREGLLPTTDSIVRRYAKYAKTIVEVGAGGARAFSRTAGHPLEFIPQSDPATLRAGDTLVVQLRYRGAPLGGAMIAAGAAGERGPEARHPTDADGLASVVMAHAGLWNVRTIHIVPSDRGSGADWDVHWSTLVVSVSPR